MKPRKMAPLSGKNVSKKIEYAANRKDNSTIRTAMIIGPILLFGFIYLLAKFSSII